MGCYFGQKELEFLLCFFLKKSRIVLLNQLEVNLPNVVLNLFLSKRGNVTFVKLGSWIPGGTMRWTPKLSLGWRTVIKFDIFHSLCRSERTNIPSVFRVLIQPFTSTLQQKKKLNKKIEHLGAFETKLFDYRRHKAPSQEYL